MNHGLGRIAGIIAFGLMVFRLGRLLESGGDASGWQPIMLVSAFLGGVIWTVLSQALAKRRTAIAIFAVTGTVLFLRIAVPDTLLRGFVPTRNTLAPLSAEIAQAIDVIRFGLVPVFPTPGVITILAILAWAIGALFAWGASRSTTAMVLPSLALYLEFAVMDRLSNAQLWMGATAAIVGLSLAALAMERRTETGQVRNAEGRLLRRRTGARTLVLIALIAAGSIAASNSAAGFVPLNGNLPWRTGSGYGQGSEGVTFDRLADLRQQLIAPPNSLMFTAVLDENAPPSDQIYWRMEGLDKFDGTSWRPSGAATSFSDPGRAGGDRSFRYRGSSQQVAARIKIDQLRGQVVPTAGIAHSVESDTVDASLLQVTQDGSLIYRPGLNEDDEYSIQTVLPLSEIDLGSLATAPDGNLSGFFAAATEAGAIDLHPTAPQGDLSRPTGIDGFLELPNDLPAGVLATALANTGRAETNFESAWLLQYWFRDSGDFTYSTSVSTGLGTLGLDNWLDDPTSLNYRTGYCSQLAASMAILGRVLGIPSRVVWGFTPGTLSLQPDGTQVVEIRENNAHAWVEMWMDGFGWVKFDPTPRGDGVLPESATAAFNPADYLPPSNAPAAIPLEQPELPQLEIPVDDLSADSSVPWGPLAAVSLLALALGAIPTIKAVRRRRRLARLRHGDITAAWEEIVDRLTDLGQPVPAFLTPLEFAELADPSLVPLANSYSAAVYGGHSDMGLENDLLTVETWLQRRYESGERARAAFNPRSLF